LALDVAPVTSRRELREFVELPFRLHSNEPVWVPPLRIERRLYLDRRRNAFFRHGDAEYFLARRGGRVVGRISAHVDRAFNDYHANAWGMFGFLELEDDAEVAATLFEAAGDWLRGRGRDRLVGPMEFTMNDGAGILVEGFELPPMIRQPWNPPHYAALCEGAGLAKAMDLYMWDLDVSDRARVLPVIFELSEQAEREHGISIRRMTRRGLRRDLDVFAEIYNRAWRRNWGFVPYSKEDLDQYAHEMQLVFDPNWFMVAEKDGEPVGVAITVPDVNQVLARLGGRLLPFGWLKFLVHRRRIDRVRVGFLGVKPEFQHLGVAARLYVEHFDTAARRPQRGGETGWILETNEAMNRGMEAMGGRIVKRYRMYERPLNAGGAG
jgi:ribosomal protein S18 acetylase RimI-like enzyme